MQIASQFNSFYFRAGLLRKESRLVVDSTRFNPFYFRAGLLPGYMSKLENGLGFNPFYVRAGLLLDDCRKIAPSRRF